MTLSTLETKVTHTSNASVTQYAFPFRVLAAKYVWVIVADPVTYAEVLLVPGTDYSVSGVDVAAGGAVVLTASGRGKAGTGKRLVILRATVFDQAVDYRAHDVFPAETHERILDKLVMHDQELREILGRAVVAPVGTPEDEIPQWGDFVKLHDEAQASAVAAKVSETAAKASEVAAKVSQAAAAGSASAAKVSETAAKASETAAKASEASAASSASAAKASEAVVKSSADQAASDVREMRDLWNSAWVHEQIWAEAINSTRLTVAALRRSMDEYRDDLRHVALGTRIGVVEGRADGVRADLDAGLARLGGRVTGVETATGEIRRELTAVANGAGVTGGLVSAQSWALAIANTRTTEALLRRSMADYWDDRRQAGVDKKIAAVEAEAAGLKTGLARVEGLAAGLEDEIAAVGGGSTLWTYAINTVRLTDSGVRRSKELFKLGGY